MLTPEEYNKMFMEAFSFGDKTKAPVKCPKCGERMNKTRPGCIFLTYPGQMDIDCPKCGHINRVYEAGGTNLCG